MHFAKTLLLVDLNWFLASGVLSKQAFLEILNRFIPLVRKTSIRLVSRAVGRDTDIAIGRSTVSTIINILCHKWIKLQMSVVDSRKSKH